jgi:hypothetical protein
MTTTDGGGNEGGITKNDAIRIAREHVMPENEFRVTEGWPEGAY